MSFPAVLLQKQLEGGRARKEWKLAWADVIRHLDSLIEAASRCRRYYATSERVSRLAAWC